MGKYKKVIKNNIFKVSALTWNKEFEFPDQGRSEGTSNVALKALIIKFERDFINLFIFNCLTSNINLFNFNCLTSNFCFPKKSKKKIFETQINF